MNYRESMRGKVKIHSGKLAKQIAVHGSIFLKGFVRMFLSAATAALLVVSIYGFLLVPYNEGYDAVGSFVVSGASMVVALGCVYLIGGKCRTKKTDK